MTETMRPTFISLLLMTVAVAGLTSFVEGRRGERMMAPVPMARAIQAPVPQPVATPRAPERVASAPAAPLPPTKPALRAAPPAQVAALPPLPAPKPRAVDPLLAKARRGDPEAQLELGLAYAARGEHKRSAAWFREAAIAGVPEARLRLAEQYRLGRGLPADPLEAFIWTKSAAEQGLPAAQLTLGDAFERGLGVPPMPVEAYVWYVLAAQAGDAEAQQRRDRLGATLAPAARASADARAATLAASLAPSRIPNRHLVAEIQRLLRSQGYDAGLDDGVSGERTVEAIRRYQQDKGMVVDGEPSEALVAKLRAAVRPPPPPPVD
jgi:localization factor PodJL